MAEERTDLYEGFFLVNQSVVGELDEAINFVTEILNRARCEIVAIQRWDERRLAYPINGQRRGLYILAYFNAPRSLIANIERDVSLSDEMLRCLVTRADHIGDFEMDLIKSGEKLTAIEAKLREGAATAKPEPPAESPKEALAATTASAEPSSDTAAATATETATETAAETATSTDAAPDASEAQAADEGEAQKPASE